MGMDMDVLPSTRSATLAFEEQLPLHTPLETHGNVYTHGNKC